MKVKFLDYVGQTVYAQYVIERNVDGADVPVLRQGEVTVCLDEAGSVVLDDDGDMVYPCDQEFQLLTPKQ